MLTYLKNIFSNHCPSCKLPLHCEQDSFSTVKSCPEGHYQEEIYTHLGVRLVFEDEDKRG